MTTIRETFFAPGTPLDGTHFSKNRPVSDKALNPPSGHAYGMLTEIYIEALLANEVLADSV